MLDRAADPARARSRARSTCRCCRRRFRCWPRRIWPTRSKPIRITPIAMPMRRDVEAVVGDPDALPAVGGVPGVGRAHRREEASAEPAAGASRGLVDPVTHRDRGVVVNADMLPPLPTLFDAEPPAEQVVARLGESITVTACGCRHGRDGAARAPAGDDTDRGAGHAERERHWIHVDAAQRRGGAERRSLPGLWQLSVRLTPTGEPNPRETNGIGLPIAADPVIAADAGLGLPAVSVVRGGSPRRSR